METQADILRTIRSAKKNGNGNGLLINLNTVSCKLEARFYAVCKKHLNALFWVTRDYGRGSNGRRYNWLEVHTVKPAGNVKLETLESLDFMEAL